MVGRFRHFGSAPAVIVGGEAGLATVSFEELADAAVNLGAKLATRGIGKNAPVAIIGPNSTAWVGCFWSVMVAGAVAVPLDAKASDAELAQMIVRAGCRIAFMPPSRVERLREILPDCELLPLEFEPHPSAAGSMALPHADDADTAVIVYTSGTTGTPKAVPLSHRNLLSNIEALLAEGLVGAGDRVLLPLPLHHIYPLTVGLLTPFASGTAVILAENVSGPQLVSVLTSSGATILVGVPRLYAALASNIGARLSRASPVFVRVAISASGWLRRRAGVFIGSFLFRGVRARIGPSLRLLVCGGAALDRDDEEMLLDLGWEVLTGYGLSETSPLLTFNRRGESRAGTAGRPVLGTELRIAPADAEGVGEIEARGPGVFGGYLDDAAASRAAFTKDGWFRTGDLGWLDGQGYLHVVARRTETIVLSTGKKLFPEEVEAAYTPNPLIKEIAVLAHEGTLVALVVPDFEALRAQGASRLVDRVRDALANVAASLPSLFRLSGFAITREPLPRTQTGKIRRHLLPPLYARALEGRKPAEAPVLSAEDRVLLANPAAATVWDWLQGRFPNRRLDLDTSPQLDLGIDSLGWIDLTLAMQQTLGIELNDFAVARILTLRDLLRETVAAARPEATRSRAPTRPPFAAPFGFFAAFAHLMLHVAIRFTMRLAFRIRAEGLERLPNDPFVLCSNHASFLDPFAIAAALPYGRIRRLYWGGWTGVLFDTRLRRAFSYIARVLPVDPDRTPTSSLMRASAVLARGDSLVWFAEGERSRDGRLANFRRGIGVLVERVPVPIVPTRIEGAFAAWPRTRRWPRFGRITVRFGVPLDPAKLLRSASGPNRHQKIADDIREALARLNG